jgi:hypothetical protein
MAIDGNAAGLADRASRRLSVAAGLAYASGYLAARKKVLPDGLSQNVEVLFTGLAAAVRLARNDAGHPAVGEFIERERALASLEMYRIFRGWVMTLVGQLPLPVPGREA